MIINLGDHMKFSGEYAVELFLPLPILKIKIVRDAERTARLDFQVAFVHNFRCFVHGFPPQRYQFEYIIEHGVSQALFARTLALHLLTYRG